MNIPRGFQTQFGDFAEIVLSYIKKVEYVLNNYDVAIFMARKGICFYTSLIMSGIISKPSSCCVMSSRVINYSIESQLKNRKIAILDDVVVKGQSIKFCLDTLSNYNIDVDVFVAACEEGLNIDEEVKSKISNCALAHLTRHDVDLLANYITNYTVRNMVSLNIDQPIYRISKDTLILLRGDDDFFSTDLSTPIQHKYNINNRTVILSPQILCGLLLDSIDLDKVIVKLRFLYHDSDDYANVYPIVLLPQLNKYEIDTMFDNISTRTITDLVQNDDENMYYENKLKAIIFVYGAIVMERMLSMLRISDGSTSRVLSNEIVQFSRCILQEFPSSAVIPFGAKLDIDTLFVRSISYSAIHNCLDASYSYILAPHEQNSVYFNYREQEITDTVLTIDQLSEYIDKIGHPQSVLHVSYIIDILIDKSIIVPSVFHNYNGFLRGYKFGEIMHLTAATIDMFVYMLDEYAKITSDNIAKRALDKTEFEKLCVLFFRFLATKAIYASQEAVDDNDLYDIAYSYFGPRVSMVGNSEVRYKVNKPLADRLLAPQKIRLKDGKYEVVTRSFTIENQTDQKVAMSSASVFGLFRKAFTTALTANKENSTKAIEFSYIRSYNEFLILLSIGENKRNRLLSLIAEISIFCSCDMRDTNLQSLLFDLSKRYSGILSGLWKYRCYDMPNLYNRVMRKVGEVSDEFVRVLVPYELAYEKDTSTNMDKYIDDCGLFLYRVAFYLCYISEKFVKRGDRKADDISHLVQSHRADFYYSKFENMRKCIAEEVKSDDFTAEKAIEIIRRLKKWGNNKIDLCDLCTHNHTFDEREINEFIVIYFHSVDSAEFRQLYGGKPFLLNDAEKKESVLSKCLVFRSVSIRDYLLEHIDYFEKNRAQDICLVSFKALEIYDALHWSDTYVKGVNCENIIISVIKSYRSSLGNNIHNIQYYHMASSQCTDITNTSRFHAEKLLTMFERNDGYSFSRYALYFNEKENTTVALTQIVGDGINYVGGNGTITSSQTFGDNSPNYGVGNANGIDVSKLLAMTSTAKEHITELDVPQEEKESAQVYLEEIETQLKQPKPNPQKARAMLNGLKKFAQEFVLKTATSLASAKLLGLDWATFLTNIQNWIASLT